MAAGTIEGSMNDFWSGFEKRADSAARAVMKGAFGSNDPAPAPAPAPADVSTGSLGGDISATAGRAAGG
jgi:hypothetical protein